MNPRKSKELIPEVAQQLEIDPQMLRDLTDFYWKEVHDSCTSLDDLHIRVPHLGSFHIKGDKVLTREIDKLERYVGRYVSPPKTMQGYARYKQNRDKMEKMKKLVETILSENDRRKQIRTVRKTVKIQRRMEAQGINP